MTIETVEDAVAWLRSGPVVHDLADVLRESDADNVVITLPTGEVRAAPDQNMLEQIAAILTRKQAALEKHGRHGPDCALKDSVHFQRGEATAVKCTCGYAESLK